MAQPAAVSQEGLSLRDLMLVSRGAATVAVPHTNPVIAKIVQNWHNIYHRVQGFGAGDLHKVFANVSEDGHVHRISRKLLSAAEPSVADLCDV